MTDPTFDGYIEYIETFTFREKAALAIPKRIREAAYAMQIDVEIVSTDGNDYVNSKSSPEYGFYGYAVLVMRDHCEIQIPINQPRQVLYYGRVPEAFANWYALYLSFVNVLTQKAIAEGLIVPIGVELGLSVASQPLFCPTFPPWQELPIRELYIKSRFGTQFKVETTWTEPLPVAYGECSYDGRSGQTDGNKDDGLPSDGVQPQNNGNPSSPYDGFPPADSAEELGDFFNAKQDSLDSPRESNAPVPPPPPSQTCTVTVTVPFISASDTGIVSGLPLDVTFEVVRQLFPISSTILYYGVRVVNGVGNTNIVGWYDGSDTLSPTPIHWSQSETFVSAVCELD